MKSWEKVMFYLLFPFAIFWHGVKKSVKYMERKSKPTIAMLVAVTMMLSVMPMQSFALASSVEISTLSDLQSFKSRIESGEGSLDAVLTASIDMSSVTDWNGIGTTESPYTGTFDGQGYTISNLTGSMGLFAESSGTVKNVYMKNVSIDGGGNNGAVVGHNTGTVLNCVSTGTVSGNSWSVGGIVGYNEGGAVLGCMSSCTVSGGTAGGLIGSNWGNGHISYCYYGGTNANIEGDSNYAKASSEAVYFQTGSGYQLYNNDSAVSAETVVTTVNTYITNNGGYFKLSTLGNTVLFPHASHPVCGAAHTDIGNHMSECGNVTWTAWYSADSLPTEAGNYYLTGNVNLGSVVWDVPSGETKICLNGKELKAKKINIASGNALTISDCGETGTVKRNGGFFQSGTIVENAGIFNLYGGSITSNTNWYGYGGGVINNGTFNMYGGAVTRNGADRMGGGVYNASGATFNLYSGSITKNSGGTGGGLYNAGKFNMYGGEITGNKTDMDSYGGIYSATRINISGKVVINGNTNKNGDPSNYCSSNDGAVMIVGTLEAGSSIGVTRYNDIGTITAGGDEYIDYFFSDDPQYFVEKDGENLKLSEKVFTVTVTSSNVTHGTASANMTSGTQGTRVLLKAEPAEGYRLKEWKLISGGGTLYQSGSFYIGTENAEIQAVFEQPATYTVQFNANGGTGSKDSVNVFEGDSYILPTNPFTAPTGKRFKAWSVGDKEYAVGDPITVLADTTVKAIWENIPAEAPTVTAGENLTLTYKGYTGKQVSVTVTEKDGYTYSYQWCDGNGQPIGGATDKAYPVPGDLTVGSYKYYCKVTAKRNDNALTESTDSEKMTVTIQKADQNAPAVQSSDETISGKKDGSITAVNSTMEYRKDGESTYTAISGETVTDLAAGKYYVRVKGDSNHNPSPDTEITIAAGRKLEVTIPTAEEQIGYTLTVDKNALDWQGQVVIIFALADGYSKSKTDFAVKVNGSAITLDENEQYIVTGAETDLTITVAGVVDITAPEAEISISTNKWTEFLKDITFGLFFKETQDVTITAIDKGSGEDTIYYYISEDVLTEDEVKTLAADKWTEYDADNKPSIDPDKECVVYVKATDKAQNVKFISSTGLVFDGTAPALFSIENGGVYYGDKIFKALDDNFLKIEVDGIDITDTTQGDDEYKVVADNAEHTVTVTDKAGNITEWKITVYKQYTVTFMDENGVYKTVTVKHGEKVEMPEVPTKDGYTVKWEKVLDTVTEDATVKAVYTEIPTNDMPSSPRTGDNINIWLWTALLFVSGGLFGTIIYKKSKKQKKTK